MLVDLLVCTATDLESSLLKESLPSGGRILVTGVGSVNAASSLTRFLEREGAKAIVVCGIGGAYPGSGLALGDVAWAESETYGDLGAASAQGFLDMRAMGFPVIAGDTPIYNVLPVDLRPALGNWVRFVTVNTCTGSDQVAAELSSRTGGSVENMEGAAIAHVARLYGIPCGEVRGISNPVGNRDRSVWRVKEGAIAAQEALLAALASGDLRQR